MTRARSPRDGGRGIAPAAAPLRPARLHPGWLALGVVALLAALLVGALVGAAELSVGAVLRELASRLPGVTLDSGLEDRQAAILWQLRLPRVVLGALVGGTLALAGAAYQGVFRNPLADPYLLGVAAGAGLGATLAIAYGPDTGGWPVDVIPLAAFVGALTGVAMTYAMGRAVTGVRTATTLVLAGVAVASFLTAVQTFVQQREVETLREVYAWILGRLATGGWADVRLLLPYAAASAIVILLHRRLLDVLAVGEEEADSLGVRTGRVRLWVVLAASLGTAAAVSVSGLIGFVGIVVPHAIRLLAGVSHRSLLPLSLLFGGAFLVAADVLARTLTSPAELPIGVVTAFVGAPFFAVVLRTSGRVS